MRHAISEMKEIVISQIKELVEPHLWESGFIKSSLGAEKREYTRLCTRQEEDRDGEMHTITYTDDVTGLEMEGFTCEGIITDSHMCIATRNYDDLMIEELLFALDVARNEFPEGVNDQPAPVRDN